MASMEAENWDDTENFELSPRNHSLLMSLLDETQVDECDDERLRNVIRSLEAEIDSAGASDLAVDCESMTCDDLDPRWMDHIESVADVDGWYTEFGWVKSYSSVEVAQDYGSLWHDTDAPSFE